MIPGLPDKVVHFALICGAISVVVTVLKKDGVKETVKGVANNFALLSLLIIFFCVILQFLASWI